MNARRTTATVVAGAALTLGLTVTAQPAQAAPTRRWCTPIQAVDDSVIGGQEIITQVTGTVCLGGVWITGIRSTSRRPYRLAGVSVWQTTPDTTHGWKIAEKATPPTAATSHRVRVMTALDQAAAGDGWAGWVRITIRTAGKTRTVSIHV